MQKLLSTRVLEYSPVLVVVQNIDNHKHVSNCIDVHQYIDMYSLFSPILRVPPGYFPGAFRINLVLLPAGTPPKLGKSTGCEPDNIHPSESVTWISVEIIH